MPAGADKAIVYDPPGAIGLVDREAILQLRFDEVNDGTRPRDTVPVCQDFDVGIHGTVAMPEVTSAVLGRGRQFNGVTTGIGARDLQAGATLLTRDMSIQVVLSWDCATQAANSPGVIVSRGIGGTTVEQTAYGIRLDVVDAPSFTGLLRWFWQDTSGTERLQAGAQVVIPPGQFTMLTATRRWITPTSVELNYYVGDQLIGTVTSVDGSIGGGTTGAMQIGYRTTGGTTNTDFYAGIIDELLILDRELCQEEIEMTWLRLTFLQPQATEVIKQMMDPGYPACEDAGSDTQLDIRMEGHALGFVASHVENLRRNFLPQRAYGTTLEQWEQAVTVTPAPVDGIKARRARVLARLAQHNGCSVLGIQQALAELIDCDPAALEILSYDDTIRDSFDTTVSPILWDMTAGITGAGGKAHFAPGAGTYQIFAQPRIEGWCTMATGISRPDEFTNNLGEHVMVKLAVTTPQSGAEFGLWIGDRGARNFVTIGLQDSSGTFRIVTEVFANGIAPLGQTVQATLGGNPAAIWLYLYQAGTQWVAAWSTTSATAGFTSTAPFDGPAQVRQAGLYLRSNIAIAAPVADFDDFVLWMPNATRPMGAFVFRDPALGGSPDIEGANSVIDGLKHAYVTATLTESKAFRVGIDPLGRTPLGPAL